MSCEFISKHNNPCSNIKLDGSNYCHNPNHYDDKAIFSNILENIKRNFVKSRTPLSDFSFYDVTADGACLYRCIVNGLFTYSGKNLAKLCQLFINNQYFPLSIDKSSFIGEYLELSSNFEADCFNLPEEIETELAECLQKMVVSFVKNNKDLLILEKYPKYIEIMPDYTIENIIQDTHEVTLEEYLKNYEKFAGEDDFEYIEKTCTSKGRNKRQYTKRVKKYIDDRWGGIPELLVTSYLFNIGMNIYIPQIFDERLYRQKTIQKINKRNDVFLYLIDTIDITSTFKINLLLTQKAGSPHYIYLQ